MPLFRENPVRSVAAVIGALAIGYLLTKILSSFNAFHLTQTAIAMLAIAALMLFVTMHHRREGHLLTQTQEEMVLIAGFGLFWLAILLAWQGTGQRGTAASPETGTGRPESSGQLRERSRGLPYPCSRGDYYCVVEEYSYF